MEYDRELDEHIIEVLEENGEPKRYFNDLLRILNERYYTKGTKLRPRTLTKHLGIMEKQKIIERDPKKPYKRYVGLHPNTVIQRKYHFFRGVEGVRTAGSKEEKKKERDRKLALFLILFLGYGRDKIIGDTRDLKFFHYKEPGFFPSDIQSDAVGASPLQTLLVVNRFSEDEVKSMLKELTSKEHEEIPLHKILSSDIKFKSIIFTNEKEIEIGYRINDDILESFLYRCVEILSLLVEGMKKKWYFLTRRPKKDELSWFYFVCGKNYLTNLFTQIEENKAKKRTIKDLCIDYFYQKWKDDPARIDSHIAMMEKTFPDHFTKPGIERELAIEDKKIQQDLNFFDYDRNREYFLHIKDKYGWILPSIKEIIRPKFLKSKFVSDFFDTNLT